MSLLLKDVLERHGRFEAIVDGSKRLTFLELGDLVRSLAGGLQDLGVQKGELAVIWGENGWRWEVTALACWWSGLTVVPISGRLKSLEVLPILMELRPAAFFAGRDSQDHGLLQGLSQFLREQSQALEHCLPDSRGFIDFSGNPATQFLCWDRLVQETTCTGPEACTAIEPDDACLIMYTSGTTGKPKGVVARHGGILHSCMQPAAELEWPRDRIILNTPLSHMYGQYSMIRSLMLGFCQVFGTGVVGDDLTRLIQQEKISLLSGPPSLFQQLLMQEIGGRTALHGVRKVSSGGAPLSEKLLLDMINSGVEMVQVGYGLTEYPRVTGSTPGDKTEHICTTVGRPDPETRVKLVDGEDREVPVGEVGEVLVSGNGLMKGYWGEGGIITPAVDAEGWFHTGDLGRVIDGGFLQVVGRKKEMFISHGFNVYPAEVENLLLKSGLLEAVAVISRASRLGGEEGIAVIVPKKGLEFDLNALRNWVHRNLADYKVPTRYIETEYLPLNVNGKVDKLALGERYLSGASLERSQTGMEIDRTAKN
jgi:acyl-CoA synthetase (AMP-forming)/AMP-acid ligase II